MAFDNEDMIRRREARAAQRRRQQEEQRKLRIRLILAGAVLLVCGLAIFFLSRGAGDSGNTLPAETTEATRATQETQETSRRNSDPTTTIHIRAAGDLNITDAVVASGDTIMGYDYTKAFMDVAHVLSDADLTVMNFEGNACGAPYGTESTSAPQQLLEAVSAAGVDVLQAANSCSLNNGLRGLSSTLGAIRAAGMEPVGAYASNQEFQQRKGYTIVEIQGLKVAIVAFTKGVGNRGLPTGNEDCVNLLYTDYSTTYQKVDTEGITAILKAAESEKPDITIAMLHWGSEDNDNINSSQKSIISLMQKRGVDIILGTHPHKVQEIAYDQTTGTLVAYSLGDFYGDAVKGGTNYSIILDIEITRDNDTGITKVTNYSIIPIYTLKETECDGQRRVVRIDSAIAAYDANYVDKITATCYASMKNALERINARISPPKTEEEK